MALSCTRYILLSQDSILTSSTRPHGSRRFLKHTRAQRGLYDTLWLNSLVYYLRDLPNPVHHVVALHKIYSHRFVLVTGPKWKTSQSNQESKQVNESMPTNKRQLLFIFVYPNQFLFAISYPTLPRSPYYGIGQQIADSKQAFTHSAQVSLPEQKHTNDDITHAIRW